MYKIGELSKLCRIPVRTLRYYDEEGLLPPDYVDRFSGYRYYSASKLDDCYKIIALKELGFSLDDIKKQLHTKGLPKLLVLLSEKEQELSKVILQTQSQINRIRSIKEYYQKENGNMVHIIVRKEEPFRVAVIRDIFKDREQAEKQIEKMRRELFSGILGKRDVIINYEVEYGDHDFDFAAGFELVGNLPKDCLYIEKSIPFTHDVACLVCKTQERDQAYLSMVRFLEENRYQIIGPCYEIIHEDGTVELKTDVCKLTERKDQPVNDSIDLPFVDDPDVIGHWKVIDIVPSKDHFNIQKLKHTGAKAFDEFYFLPGGEPYWCFGWTKGFFRCRTGDGNKLEKYEIFELNHEKYMFLENKGMYYSYQNGEPDYFVLKQSDQKAYIKDEIAKKDFIDYPFGKDERLIGKWESVDFTDKIENFKVGSRYTGCELWLKALEFLQDGLVEVNAGNKIVRDKKIFRWTKDYMINVPSSFASRLLIKRICDDDYLFVEWKSGDYAFGHREPNYYVLKKIK